MRYRRVPIPAWILGLALSGSPAWPQEGPQSLRPEEFGVSDEVTSNLNPSDFQPSQGAWSSAVRVTDSYYQVASGSSFVNLWAPLHLPDGALIKSVRVYYHDSYPSEDPVAELTRFNAAGTQDAIASISFPNFSAGFNTIFQSVAPAEATVDNESYHYAFLMFLRRSVGDPSEEHRLIRVRIRYVRQVSPGPFFPSFDDVPSSHPYYKHIEALLASGITSGCQVAPPLYCPGAFITRGEMAVFLAKALGLHWPLPALE
jgi:S-layer homology domain